MEALVEPERLTWSEICARYPEQYVFIVDERRGGLGSDVNIVSARVIANGSTLRSMLDLAREPGQPTLRASVQFTGTEIIQHRPLSWALSDESRTTSEEPAPVFRRASRR